MSSSRRTWLLNDLRAVRDGLEKQYDALRDMSLYNLPNAKEAIGHLKASIIALKQEIDYGENHMMPDCNWPRPETKT